MRSLRTKLFVTVTVLVLIPLAVLSVTGFFALNHILGQTTRRNLESLGQLQVSQIREFLREKEKLALTLFAGDQGVQQLIQSIDASQRSSQAKQGLRQRLQHILRQKMEQSHMKGVGIKFVKGGWFKVGASMKRQIPIIKPFTRGFRILDILHFNRKVSDTVIRMVTPLRSGRQLRAYLVTDFPFDLHERFLQEKRGPAFQGNIYLLNESDRVICGSLDFSHHIFGIEKRYPENKKSRVGLPRAHLYMSSGQRIFGLALPMRNIRWTLLIELPYAKAFASLWELGKMWILLVFAVFLLLVVAIAVVANQLIQPLYQLVEATRAYGQGNFVVSLPRARQDEVGELTHSFKTMGEELRDLYDTLEEKVEERTQELHDAQRFLELLFHAIPEVIFCVDRELRITTANRKAKELFGEDVIGTYCYHIWGGDSNSPDACPATKVLQTGEPHFEEDEVPHPMNGELFYKDFYPIRNDDGEVVGVLESAKVITQKKQLMAQAIHREKMAAIGLLASGVAHEIGNPLASIFALVQRLIRQSDDPKVKEAYRELLERCESISRILGNLNSYAKKKGDGSIPLDLNREIEKTLTLLRFDKRMKQTHIEFLPGKELPMLWAQEDALLQIVTNLLMNALDAVNGTVDPSIVIETWPSRDGASFSVKDNGQGLEGDITKVFEPFVTTKDSGTGLGLSICKTIVSSMGGSIQARENQPQGAIFEVVLPSTQASEREDSM